MSDITNIESSVDFTPSHTEIAFPTSEKEAEVGCWIAYSAARKRFGSFQLGEVPGQCHRWHVDYQVNSLKEDTNSSWIEYLSLRLLGVEKLDPIDHTEPTPTPNIGGSSDLYTPTFGMLNRGSTPRAPTGALDTSKTYFATFKTDAGEFKVLLFDDEAPLTVENFINLATIGFYDGLMFHRVIPNFMAQGGDPKGTGAGGPGYHFSDEFDNNRRHDKPGILSMANAGSNTNGSQFFITFVATPTLTASTPFSVR
jgi:cyclophilin family peptidyl-prolyl cis-trans isomerase